MKYQKYKYRKYDSIYPKLFEAEKNKIIKVLTKNAKIEHVGSTAVEGLGGKGIIDVAIMVPKPKLNESMEELKKLGFEYSPNHPGDDRRFFMQKIIKYNGKERRVHIHLCRTKKFWDSFILFRDYLRKNKKAKEEYNRIKKEGSRIAKGDGEKYAKHKQGFLKKTLKKALKVTK